MFVFAGQILINVKKLIENLAEITEKQLKLFLFLYKIYLYRIYSMKCSRGDGIRISLKNYSMKGDICSNRIFYIPFTGSSTIWPVT